MAKKKSKTTPSAAQMARKHTKNMTQPAAHKPKRSRAQQITVRLPLDDIRKIEPSKRPKFSIKDRIERRRGGFEKIMREIIGKLSRFNLDWDVMTENVAQIPPSSTRLDGFYAERKAKRAALLNRRQKKAKKEINFEMGEMKLTEADE